MYASPDILTIGMSHSYAAPISHPQGVHRLMPLYTSLRIPTMRFVEGFGGMASGITSSLPVPDEYYIERDSLYVNFWRAIRDLPVDEIIKTFRSLPTTAPADMKPYLRRSVHGAEAIRNLMVRTYFAWGGFRENAAKVPKPNWDNRLNRALWSRYRFSEVTIKQGDALKLIPKLADADTLFFLDPPYAFDPIFKTSITMEHIKDLVSTLIGKGAKVILIASTVHEDDAEDYPEWTPENLPRHFKQAGLKYVGYTLIKPVRGVSKNSKPRHRFFGMNYDPPSEGQWLLLPRMRYNAAKSLWRRTKWVK